MKTTINLLKFTVLALLFQSCNIAYLPTTVQSPIFENEGDANATAAVTFAGSNFGAAYAINDFLMATADLTVKTNPNRDSNTLSQTIGSVGFGAYKSFDDGFMIGALGGLGFGSFRNFDSFSNSFVNSNITKIFATPYFGKSNEFFTFKMGSRLMFTSQELGFQRRSGFYFEPFINLEVGYEYIKFFSQGGLSLPFNNNTLDGNPLMFSLGVSYNLNIFDTFRN